MTSEFEAIIEKDGDWFVAYSPDVTGANGQGRTVEEARGSLAQAIALILEDRRADTHKELDNEIRRKQSSLDS